MNKPNLKKASTYYFVGNIFNKGMSFLTVPIFTRILTETDYGIVSTYNSWVSILCMVTGMAIYMGIRAAFIDYRNEIDDFMSVSTTFNLIFGGTLCIVTGIALAFLPLNVPPALAVICVLHGMGAGLLQNYSMYLMMQLRYRFRTALMVLPNLLSVIFSIIVILLIKRSSGYWGRIVPTAMTSLGFGLLTTALIYRKSTVYFRKDYLSYALKISGPLVIHGIALDILSQSDRTMITWLSGADKTAIYSLVYNFSMLAVVITTSLDGIWVPWFNERLIERDIRAINKRAVDYIYLMTYAMIGVIMVGPEVIKLLATESYWEGIGIIPPIVLSNYLIFNYTLYVNIEHFYKRTIYISANTFVAAAINLVLNYIFISRFGYPAAAYTTFFSYFVAFVMHATYAKRLEKELFPLRYFVTPLLHILAAVVLFYLSINAWYIRWIAAVLYLSAMFYLNRETIFEVFPEFNTVFHLARRR